MSGRLCLWQKSRFLNLAIAIGLTLVALGVGIAQESAQPSAASPIPSAAASGSMTWDFDSDKAGNVAEGWRALEGNWMVIPDKTAPSPPNTFGLPPGRLMKSLLHALDYYPEAILIDPAQHSDFTLEVSFKTRKGYFDCSAGLILRYMDAKNYYVLGAGCPSDYFALYRVSKGKSEMLRQSITPIDEGVWYKLKAVVVGDRFSGFLNDKLLVEVTDDKIGKGRIGLWARDDSQVRYDNVKLVSTTSGQNAPADQSVPLPPPGSGTGESIPSLPPLPK